MTRPLRATWMVPFRPISPKRMVSLPLPPQTYKAVFAGLSGSARTVRAEPFKADTDLFPEATNPVLFSVSVTVILYVLPPA